MYIDIEEIFKSIFRNKFREKDIVIVINGKKLTHTVYRKSISGNSLPGSMMDPT